MRNRGQSGGNSSSGYKQPHYARSVLKLIYVGNVTGRALRTGEAISEDLATNIAHGVRWYDATMVLTELGCRLFLEMPPGHVLTELGREAFSGVRTLAVGETSLTHALLEAAKEK